MNDGGYYLLGCVLSFLERDKEPQGGPGPEKDEQQRNHGSLCSGTPSKINPSFPSLKQEIRAKMSHLPERLSR